MSSEDAIKGKIFFTEAIKYDPDYAVRDGIVKDFKEAMVFYDQAINHGDSAAMFNMGTIYDPNIKKYGGIKKDAMKAIEYYQKAVDRGDHKAMCNLGTIYDPNFCPMFETEITETTEKNIVRAIELYEKAQECGSKAAGLNLAPKYDPMVTSSDKSFKNVDKAINQYKINIKNGYTASSLNKLIRLYESDYCNHIDYIEKLIPYGQFNSKLLDKLFGENKDEIISTLIDYERIKQQNKEILEKNKELLEENNELKIHIKYMPPEGGIGFAESENNFNEISNKQSI